MRGKPIDSFPIEGACLEELEPIYEELSGWSEALGEVRSFERLVGVDIVLVSVGAAREQTIMRRNRFLA